MRGKFKKVQIVIAKGSMNVTAKILKNAGIFPIYQQLITLDIDLGILTAD
jgi:hypothetical protein